MRRVVPDASVLAAVAFREPDAKEWSRRLEGVAVYAPTLLRYELQSVARKKCRERPSDVPRILRALEVTLDPLWGMTWLDPNPLDVVLIANRTGLSAYDASYLWLAGMLEAELLTRDATLAAALDPFAAW